MARINIDDDVESKLEYKRLNKLLNYEEDKALGMLVRFWRLAQDYWGRYELIPHQVMEDWGFQVLIDSRWAIVRPEGVYAIGSEEMFAWYRQKCDAGKRSAEIRRTKTNETVTEVNPVERNTVSVEPLTLSLSLAPTQILKEERCALEKPTEILSQELSLKPNLDLTERKTKELTLANQQQELGAPIPKRSKFNDLTRAKMKSFIAAYSQGYKAKYHGSPEGLRDKAIIGKIGHWIEHVSEVRAVSLVEVYMQISYRPIDESYHDLWQFFRHLNRIGVALDTGKDASQIDWAKVFSGGSAA